MSGTGIADFRSAIRQAIDAAAIDEIPPETRVALLLSEVGHLAADWANGDDLEAVISNLQAAVAYAARTAREEARYQQAVERFVERWLN